MKRVFYNGHKETMYPCQSASNLKAGICYEVEDEIEMPYQTNYIIRNVENHIELGECAGYNSAWFKVVPVYQAVSNSIPCKGEKMKNFKRFNSANLEWEKCEHSSRILKVIPLSDFVYEVYTQYSTYIVLVK